jgi:tRNA uridine 5-carbamoylmethylation protein Kti12
MADQWDEDSFGTSREKNIAQLQDLIQQPALDGLHKLIIVDDIMYLHSMRRAIYVKTRDLDIHNPFVIRVSADYSTALTRNSLRPDSKRVAEDTLLRIFNQFEEPNTSLVHERNNYVVDTMSSGR